MCVYIYICCYVQFRGAFSHFQVFKNAPFFASRRNHFETKKSCFPPTQPCCPTKLCLEMTTSNLSSSAFNNRALMLRNIGTPLSNAYRRPIVERVYFPSFGPFFAMSSKPRHPYFCGGFWYLSTLFSEPHKHVQQDIADSPKYKWSNEKRK